MINGEPLDPNRVYTAAVMAFLVDVGDDGLDMLVASKNPDNVQLTDLARVDARQALIDELQATYP